MELSIGQEVALAALMFIGAILYTSVGHAGASAYLALMGLFGVPAPVMRPTALVLNVLVASLTSWRYVRSGMFRWRVLWPFIIGAAPLAFFGGSIQIPGQFYKPLVGVILWIGATRLLWPREIVQTTEPHDPPIVAGVAIGAGIGLLSGLTGTGGGIFLSPILLFMNWTDPKKASGIAAVFILVVSLLGLAGNVSSVRAVPSELPIFVGAVFAGALIGTFLGIKRFSPAIILKALGVVLVVAGFKLVGMF